MPRNILIVESAMSKDLCRRIIERFEEDPSKDFESGDDYAVRHSIQLTSRPEWAELRDALCARIESVVERYFTNYEPYWQLPVPKKRTRRHSFWQVSGLQVSRYTLTQYCSRHFDGMMAYPNDHPRLITVLFYLNDVVRGGDTVFPAQGLRVRPTAGKAVLFPPTFHYPHEAEPPLSNSRYITHCWITDRRLRVC